MEEVLLLVAALIEEEEEALKRRRLLKSLRDNNDPFSIQELKFIQTFRFPKSLCQELIQELEPNDVQKSSIPFTLRFLACLYFYSHGSYQKSVGNSDPISMSQSSISRAMYFISKLIVDVKNSEIRFPLSDEDVSDIKKGFNTKFQMKDIIGIVGCTHVGILQPSATDPSAPVSLFINKKGFYSMNIEAVCDHRLLFTSVNARFPGSFSNSDVWTNSPTRDHLKNKYNTQSDLYLLGNRGYPSEPWLLTPVSEPINSKEIEFNKLHVKAHSTIHRAFGVLRKLFRCLSQQRILHYSPERAVCIIYACTILYNILLRHGLAKDNDLWNIPEEPLPRKQKKVLAELDDFKFYNNKENTFETKEGAKVRDRYINSL